MNLVVPLNTDEQYDRRIALQNRLRAELDAAESKAWDSLSKYKFQMFGYWAAIWVHLNRVGEFKRPNPWRVLVHRARAEREVTA